MGGGPGKWVQPSRWGAKRGDPWTRWTSTFMEGQDGVHKKRHEGLSLMHENVTGSQAEKRILWSGPPYHMGALSHLGGVLTA